jgi:hypothetical protein
MCTQYLHIIQPLTLSLQILTTLTAANSPGRTFLQNKDQRTCRCLRRLQTSWSAVSPMHTGGIKTQAEFKSHLLADTHTQTLRVISDNWSQQ